MKHFPTANRLFELAAPKGDFITLDLGESLHLAGPEASVSAEIPSGPRQFATWVIVDKKEPLKLEEWSNVVGKGKSKEKRVTVRARKDPAALQKTAGK